jgi:DNA end-binding protein Ku
MIDKTYYLVPDSKIPGPYFVMQQAMQGKLGIGKITLNGKERQVAISTRGNGFLMYTLLTKAEIRQADALEQLQHVPKVNEDEVRMAHMLIDRLVVDEYDLESFEDSYKKAVRAVIEARVKGEAPTVQAAIADPQATTSLMDALKSMLDTVQPSAKKQQQAKAVLPMPKAKPQVVAMAARRTTKKVAK